MAEFIREAEVRHEVRYWREFALRDHAHSMYRFPSDADGEVDRAALPERARANYDACVAGTLDVVDRGVWVDERRWRQPALIRCDCRGATVELAGFTNTCTRCGRDYDSGGSLLAPREQWGEETGESLAEILRIR